MDAMRFLSPVPVRVNGVGREIDNLSDALAFLNGWPKERRGPVYDCALRSCRAAASGQMTTQAARTALESFARITGLIDRFEPLAMPVVVAAAELKNAPKF